MNLLYCGYLATLSPDPATGTFHGRVARIRDVVTFQGATPGEARQAFRESVDGYLASCKERGVDPDPPAFARTSRQIAEHRAIHEFFSRCKPTRSELAALGVIDLSGIGAFAEVEQRLARLREIRSAVDRSWAANEAGYRRLAAGDGPGKTDEDADIDTDLDYLIEKNNELYRRLATPDGPGATPDAIELLRRKYVGDDPDRQALLDEYRIMAGVEQFIYDLACDRSGSGWIVTLHHAGYAGSFEVDEETGYISGHVLGISGRVSYDGDTPEEVAEHFRHMVDTCLPCRLPHVPNAETLQVLRDANAGIGLTCYESANEMFEATGLGGAADGEPEDAPFMPCMHPGCTRESTHNSGRWVTDGHLAVDYWCEEHAPADADANEDEGDEDESPDTDTSTGVSQP